jgi:hypothetical protein
MRHSVPSYPRGERAVEVTTEITFQIFRRLMPYPRHTPFLRLPREGTAALVGSKVPARLRVKSAAGNHNGVAVWRQITAAVT